MFVVERRRVKRVLPFRAIMKLGLRRLNEWSGNPTATNVLLKHGNAFGAELISVSGLNTADKFLGPRMPVILTLHGWCKDINSFRTCWEFYPESQYVIPVQTSRAAWPRYLRFR